VDLGLQDRVVMVAGGSGVIGRAIAEQFGAERARVLVGYHAHEEAALETASAVQAAGGEAALAQLDLSRPELVRQTLARLDATWSGIEVLVNSAVAWPEPTADAFEDIPLDRVTASVTSNLVGVIALSQLAVSAMRRRGWGRVVHLSTGLVEDGFAGSTAYTAAKAGLHGLTRTMSRELAAAGILVNTVMPGYVPHGHEPQELIEQVSRSSATRRPTRAAEVAGLVAYLASPLNGAVTGQLIRADGHFLTRD
jgi:3-oxoacyl-[acyl-carrier protein] reductase